MRLTLAEPKYLKESISIISELVNETRIKVTKDAIELVAMDPANVAMVVFKLLSSSFTEYKVENEVDIAVNLTNLKQILRRAKPNDAVTLELEESRLKIQLKSNSTRTFTVPIIDIDEKDQKIPDLQFPVTIETDSIALTEAIEDVDIVGESVSFGATSEVFSLSAEGDLNKASIDLKPDDTTKISMSGEGTEVKAKYSVEYLKKMIPSSKLSDKVTIQFNKDYPLKLNYTTVDRVVLSFILAPRVDND